MAPTPRLALRRLDKTFGPAQVLTGVDLVVGPGEVHGLAGQNGSGKSTLVKIVTGVYTPDPGAVIEVDGRAVRLPVRWPEVRAAGVSVVHQDLGLLEELNVADNISIGGYPVRRLTHRIDRVRQREQAVRALERIGADIDPARPTATLSAPERAEVAIARALRDHRPGGGLIIMDESTRTMAGTDLARVHDILRRLASEGTSVLLISHSLPELLDVTDRVTILRDGRVSGAALSTSGLTEREIAQRMLGAGALSTDLRPQRSTVAGPGERPVVRLSGLGGDRVHDVSLSVDRGEIVGVTGLPRSGFEDIPYLMTGALRARSGDLAVRDAVIDLARVSIAQCLRAGVVLVPEQRGRHGIALEMSVKDNITLPNLRRHGRRWYLGRAWQRRDAEAAVQGYGIRPNDIDRLAKTLSGGNQQKVLLAKWLGAAPAVLVLHEPTQAVDVGARRDILLAIRRAAQEGVAVLIVSGEPSDLTAVCDRILIAERGAGLREAAWSSTDDLLELIYDQTPDREKADSPHA